jgi:hypothetical protein
MNLVRNEKAKLTATYVNGLGIAIFAVRSLAPLFNTLSSATAPGLPYWALAIVSGLCFAGSVALHLFARRILEGLEE